MPRLTNTKFQNFAKACVVGGDNMAITWVVFRANRVLSYDTDTMRDVGCVLDYWDQVTGKRQCLACDARLSHHRRPPVFVLARPFNQTGTGKMPGIVTGVCRQCQWRSDNDLIQVMARMLFRDTRGWRPISEAGNA